MPRFRTFAAALPVGGALFVAGAFAQGIVLWRAAVCRLSTSKSPRAYSLARKNKRGFSTYVFFCRCQKVTLNLFDTFRRSEPQFHRPHS
jgi:hypothetical protein